ncbi:MAG: hypothetical protein LAT55_07660 [Opitutales bacterium]|nr:hypothetical protein [Opitutales bacterium]
MTSFIQKLKLVPPRLAGLSLLTVFAATAFIGCAENSEKREAARSAAKEKLAELLDTYETQQGVVLNLLHNSDDPAAVERETRTLVELSLPVLDAYTEVNPRSRTYLMASKRVMDVLDTISEEAIERDYHDEAILPARPDDGGTSYHVKDLLIHPATVLVLLREEGLEARRDDMIHEIERNINHVAGVRLILPGPE